MADEVVFNFDFFAWETNPFKDLRFLSPQCVTEQHHSRKKILKALFEHSRNLVETTQWNEKSLKSMLSVLNTLRTIVALYAPGEWDLQRFEMKSWIDLVTSMIRSCLDRQCIEIESMISTFFEMLKFARDNATLPPTKYVSMSKVDQARVVIQDFVHAFEAQASSNTKRLLKVELSFLRKALSGIAKDCALCLEFAHPFRLLRRPQVDRFQHVFVSLDKVKDELLDLLLVCRAHFSFCQDLLDKYRLDSFTEKQFDIYKYMTKHSVALADKYGSDKVPSLPFKSPHINELRDSEVTVTSLVEYEALKKMYNMLREKVVKIKEDFPRNFPVVVPNLCTHNGEPFFAVSDPIDFFTLMIAYNAYLNNLNLLAEGWSLSLRKIFDFKDAMHTFDPANDAKLNKSLEINGSGTTTPEEAAAQSPRKDGKNALEEVWDFFNKGFKPSSSSPQERRREDSKGGGWFSGLTGRSRAKSRSEAELPPLNSPPQDSADDKWNWVSTTKTAEDKWNWVATSEGSLEPPKNLPPLPDPTIPPPTAMAPKEKERKRNAVARLWAKDDPPKPKKGAKTPTSSSPPLSPQRSPRPPPPPSKSPRKYDEELTMPKRSEMSASLEVPNHFRENKMSMSLPVYLPSTADSMSNSITATTTDLLIQGLLAAYNAEQSHLAESNPPPPLDDPVPAFVPPLQNQRGSPHGSRRATIHGDEDLAHMPLSPKSSHLFSSHPPALGSSPNLASSQNSLNPSPPIAGASRNSPLSANTRRQQRVRATVDLGERRLAVTSDGDDLLEGFVLVGHSSSGSDNPVVDLPKHDSISPRSSALNNSPSPRRVATTTALSTSPRPRGSSDSAPFRRSNSDLALSSSPLPRLPSIPPTPTTSSTMPVIPVIPGSDFEGGPTIRVRHPTGNEDDLAAKNPYFGSSTFPALPLPPLPTDSSSQANPPSRTSSGNNPRTLLRKNAGKELTIDKR